MSERAKRLKGGPDYLSPAEIVEKLRNDRDFGHIARSKPIPALLRWVQRRTRESVLSGEPATSERLGQRVPRTQVRPRPPLTEDAVRHKVSWWPEPEIERYLAVLQTAKDRGHRWVELYLRRWPDVETLWTPYPPGKPHTAHTQTWIAAMVGLPILSEWLDHRAPRQIAELIKQHRPFEPKLPHDWFKLPDVLPGIKPWSGEIVTKITASTLLLGRQYIPDPREETHRAISEELGKRRQTYGPAARDYANALREHVKRHAYELTLNLPLTPAQSALAAILERLPMADRQDLPHLPTVGQHALFMTIFKYDELKEVFK
ncbi:MAG: hypothetical protein HY678_06775 [Chloroflexi bacterium]|nr:hypothetical protein [Chloroflexota bacterium]